MSEYEVFAGCRTDLTVISLLFGLNICPESLMISIFLSGISPCLPTFNGSSLFSVCADTPINACSSCLIDFNSSSRVPRSGEETVTRIGPASLTEPIIAIRSEEHTSELQSRGHLVCRLLLEKKNISLH